MNRTEARRNGRNRKGRKGGRKEVRKKIMKEGRNQGRNNCRKEGRKEGRREQRRKKGMKEGRKEARKERQKEGRKLYLTVTLRWSSDQSAHSFSYWVRLLWLEETSVLRTVSWALPSSSSFCRTWAQKNTRRGMMSHLRTKLSFKKQGWLRPKLQNQEFWFQFLVEKEINYRNYWARFNFSCN